MALDIREAFTQPPLLAIKELTDIEVTAMQLLDWTLSVLSDCRNMRRLALEAISAIDEKNDAMVKVVKHQMGLFAKSVDEIFPDARKTTRIGDLFRHISFSMRQDYLDILRLDVPDIEEKAEEYARQRSTVSPCLGFDELLHPTIKKASSRHYDAGDFRHAVLDAITAVFDKIRQRTGVDLDGDKLATRVFSVDKPLLILSEVDTESGRSDQSGYLDIFKGFYRGVRNPKAHSLSHDLDALKAGQHLVLASILMRRVIEAKLVDQEMDPT